MRLRSIYLLIFVTYFISCKSNKLKSITSYRVRVSQEINQFIIDKNKDTLYVINVIKSINELNKLLLSIENKDSVINYKYKAKKKYKNLNLRYIIKKDVLVFENVFFNKEKEFIYKKKIFKLYGLSKNKGYVSHPTFLLFNKEYGILAHVAYGASFLFLKDSTSTPERKRLFKEVIDKIEENNFENQ